MNAKAEQKSLNSEPLPLDLTPLKQVAVIDYVSNCPADRVLTSIVMIDEEIQRIQNALRPYLQDLSTQREKLMARAKAEKIEKDAEAIMVEVKGKQVRNQIEDMDAFELQFPDEFKQIRENQKKALDDEYELAKKKLPDSKITLGEADEKVGKKAVTEFVGYKPVTITYEVERRK